MGKTSTQTTTGQTTRRSRNQNAVAGWPDGFQPSAVSCQSESNSSQAYSPSEIFVDEFLIRLKMIRETVDSRRDIPEGRIFKQDLLEELGRTTIVTRAFKAVGQFILESKN